MDNRINYRKPRISLDVKRKVATDYNRRDMTVKAIAQKYGIAVKTIYRILEEIGGGMNGQEERRVAIG